MRPARIRVFDGLRVATEHIDHLQDGLQSSIQDLREAVGLGHVVRGFDVTVEANGVVVGPGLAFDRARNRVAIDEPQRIDVAFPAGQDMQVLCVRHDQVEDHQVEGKPTLVWDSASLLLQPALPELGDDSIPLARLVRTEGAAFEVRGLDEPAPPPPPPPAPAAEPSAEPETPPAAEAPPAPETAPPSEGPTATEAPPPPPETQPAAETSAAVTQPAPEPPPAAAPAFRVQQGVTALPTASGADDKGLTALASAVRARAGAAEGGDVRVSLGTADAAVGFPPLELACDTTVWAEARPAGRAGWRSSAAAHGEATFAGSTVLAQFGLSTGRATPLSPGEAVAPEDLAPELAESRIAHVSLAPGAASSEPAGQGRAAVERVTLAVRVAPASGGFGLVCELVWSGDATEDAAAALEGEGIALTWGARVGWKAVGT